MGFNSGFKGLKQESPSDMLLPAGVNEYGNVFLYRTTSRSAQDKLLPHFCSLFEICPKHVGIHTFVWSERNHSSDGNAMVRSLSLFLCVCVCVCVCVCIFELHISVNNTKNIWGKYALVLGILCIYIFTLFSALAATYGGAGSLIGFRFLEDIGEG